MSDRAVDRTQWRHANPILDVTDVSRAIASYRDVFGAEIVDEIEAKPWGLRGFRGQTGAAADDVRRARRL